MIVLPLTSITCAPDGAAMLGPTWAIRLLVTSTSPRSNTSSPFMVTMRAPRSSTLPCGVARGTESAIVACEMPQVALSAEAMTRSVAAR